MDLLCARGQVEVWPCQAGACCVFFFMKNGKLTDSQLPAGSPMAPLVRRVYEVYLRGKYLRLPHAEKRVDGTPFAEPL